MKNIRSYSFAYARVLSLRASIFFVQMPKMTHKSRVEAKHNTWSKERRGAKKVVGNLAAGHSWALVSDSKAASSPLD